MRGAADGIKVLLASKTFEYIQELQKKSSKKNDNNDKKEDDINNTNNNIINNNEKQSEERKRMESSIEIGERLYNEGKYSKAVEIFLKLIEEEESNYFAQYNVGLCYLRLKEYSKAEKHLNTASILRSSYSSPYTSLGFLYFQQRQFSRALFFFQRAEQLHPSPITNHALGVVFNELKEYNKAISYYKKAIDLHPSVADPHNGLGNVYHKLKEYNKAILHYEKAIDLHPSFASPHNALGFIYKNLKEYNKAISHYEKAIDLDPSYAYPHHALGNVYYDLKEYNKAISHYEKAIDLDPSFPSPHDGLGDVFDNLKEYNKAISHYEKAIDLHPSFASPHNGLGDVYDNLKEYNKAISYYEKAIDLDPSFISPHNGLGVIYLHKKECEKALEEFNKAIEIAMQMGDDYSIFIENKAHTMIKKKEYENGLNEIQKSTEKTANYYFIMGLAHYKLSQYQHAIHHFQLSLPLSPYRFEQVYFYLAMSFIKLTKENNQLDNNNEENEIIIIIMENFNKAIESNKEWSKGYFRRAQYLLHLYNINENNIEEGTIRRKRMENIKSDFLLAISRNHLNHAVYQLSNHKILQIFEYLLPLLPHPISNNNNNNNNNNREDVLSLCDYNNEENEEDRENKMEEFIRSLYENYLNQITEIERGIEVEIFSINWRITKEISEGENGYQISRDFPHQLPFTNHLHTTHNNNVNNDNNIINKIIKNDNNGVPIFFSALLSFRFQGRGDLR